MRRSLIGVFVCVLAACGGSGDPALSGSPGASDPAPGEAGEFLDLVQQGLGDHDFKITIEITSSGDTQAESSSTITWARRSDEASYRIGEGDDSVLVIDPGDGSGQIICSGGSCYRSGDAGDLSQGFLGPLTAFGDLVRDAEDLPGFSSTGTKTIAGRAANCARWDFTGYGDNEVCVDGELGVMLSWSYQAPDGARTVWEVTEFSEPSDEDFEPTGPVQSIPSEQPSY